MRAHAIWGAVALAPLIVDGCATKPVSYSSESPGSVSSGSVVVQPPPPVVIQPGQRVVVEAPQSPTVVQPSPQMIQADDVVANEVRAQTIYANKIRAPEVQGAIHQTGQVRIDPSVPDLR